MGSIGESHEKKDKLCTLDNTYAPDIEEDVRYKE